MNKKIVGIIVLILIAAIFAYRIGRRPQSSDTSVASPSNESAQTTTPAPTSESNPAPTKQIADPISQAASRVTKKSFGTYVTPQNSPVSPEKFTGFHTGIDFETFDTEKDADVEIKTICAGKLVQKARASGYGGYAIQACTINGQAVTVIYGHLRQSSIAPTVGAVLNAGDHLAVLGTGYSTETDGERKHLHLSIHLGSSINIAGYVQTKNELSGWLDPKSPLGI
jgi:Peptidase family M23